MITAKQATDLIAKNAVNEWIEKISKEISHQAINGGHFTQVRIPDGITDSIKDALLLNGFDVEVVSGKHNCSYINITWPRPETELELPI